MCHLRQTFPAKTQYTTHDSTLRIVNKTLSGAFFHIQFQVYAIHKYHISYIIQACHAGLPHKYISQSGPRILFPQSLTLQSKLLQ